jgi:hypothetical protein
LTGGNSWKFWIFFSEFSDFWITQNPSKKQFRGPESHPSTRFFFFLSIF